MIWVEVMAVAADPERTGHRVVLRTGALRFTAGWPGPAPHVGAVRVVKLSCSEVLVLGGNAAERVWAESPVPPGAEAVSVLEAALEQRLDEGRGRFRFGEGGAVVLDLRPTDASGRRAEWQVGATYRLTLARLEAFDMRV